MKKQISFIIAYAVAAVLTTTAIVNAAECVTVHIANNGGYDIQTTFASVCDKDGNDIGPETHRLLAGMNSEKQVVKQSKVNLWLYSITRGSPRKNVGGESRFYTITQPTWIACSKSIFDPDCQSGILPVPKSPIQTPHQKGKSSPKGK